MANKNDLSKEDLENIRQLVELNPSLLKTYGKLINEELYTNPSPYTIDEVKNSLSEIREKEKSILFELSKDSSKSKSILEYFGLINRLTSVAFSPLVLVNDVEERQLSSLSKCDNYLKRIKEIKRLVSKALDDDGIEGIDFDIDRYATVTANLYFDIGLDAELVFIRMLEDEIEKGNVPRVPLVYLKYSLVISSVELESYLMEHNFRVEKPLVLSSAQLAYDNHYSQGRFDIIKMSAIRQSLRGRIQGIMNNREHSDLDVIHIARLRAVLVFLPSEMLEEEYKEFIKWAKENADSIDRISMMQVIKVFSNVSCDKEYVITPYTTTPHVY